ncbi:MAG TPA: TetR/AcrR family transcriptional regulator [Allosphingosinicella sp.]
MSLILDCAEAQFAEKGYNGVTLNEVAQEAKVDASLMRYYFGDKQQLFRAVFTRRGPALNRLRLQAMYDCRAAAGDEPPDLEGIITAFTRPAFELMAQDQGWRNYCAIIAYVNSSRGYLHQLMSETFNAVSHELLADMRRIFPGTPEEEIFWAYHFLTGAFTFSLGQTGRVDTLSDGLCRSDDVMSIADRLPTTIAAGVTALCAPASGRQQGKQSAAE